MNSQMLLVVTFLAAAALISGSQNPGIPNKPGPVVPEPGKDGASQPGDDLDTANFFLWGGGYGGGWGGYGRGYGFGGYPYGGGYYAGYRRYPYYGYNYGW